MNTYKNLNRGYRAMKYSYAFTKLYIASIVGGLCMRYSLPADVDLFGSVIGYLYSNLVLQTPAELISDFNLNDYLLALMVLPIVLGPLIYSIIIGRWGLFTFLLGSVAGYYMLFAVRPEFSLPLISVASALLVVGSMVTIYARTR